jgi:hypothetical protein
MTRISFVRLSVLLLTAVVLSSFLPAVQAEDLSPSVRFEKGLALLKEKGFTLIAEHAAVGEKPQREKITVYTDMVLVVNFRHNTTFYLLHQASEKETNLATLKPNELPAKALGAWLWYKICAAADLMESCRAASIIS